MSGPVFGEFLGMFVLILLGDATVANVVLNKSKAQGGGWIVITTGWGFAVFCGVIVSLAVGGVGHLNPAVTLAVAILSGDYSNVVPFIAAQMVGAIVAGAVVWIAFFPHWAETPDQATKLAVFCNAPAIRNLPMNAVTEIIGTFMLVLIGFAIGSKGMVAAGGGPLMTGWSPFLWGVLVWAIGLSLGGPTGYAINPARDLGPRIAHQILPIAGKGDSDWGYSMIPVFGPFIGGALAAIVIKAVYIL